MLYEKLYAKFSSPTLICDFLKDMLKYNYRPRREKHPALLHANNKCADATLHLRKPFNAFVIHF